MDDDLLALDCIGWVPRLIFEPCTAIPVVVALGNVPVKKNK